MSSAGEEIVYLEDITAKKRKRPDEDAEPSPTNTPSSSQPSSQPSKKAKDSKEIEKKAQKTLFDMIPGAAPKKEKKVPTMRGSKSVPAMGSLAAASGSMVAATPSVIVPKGSGLSAPTTTGDLKLGAIPFSLSAFQATLNEEQSALLSLEIQTMGKIWLKLLTSEITKPYFLQLKRALWEQGVRDTSDIPATLKIYPHPKDIYAWSNTPLGRVKVVIIGQDPYHGKGQAHGLSFSVPEGVNVPPSLRNIYAELKNEYPDFQEPRHGNLSAWTKAGVLLLNACLTVKASSAGSHADLGWQTFTTEVLQVVDQYGGANLPGADGFGRGVVFLAWGRFASERVAGLSRTKHLILTSAHPSPYSANKGFLGNGHFKKANDWLVKRYGEQGSVDWCTL